jgi:hypothetical protein
VPLWGPPGGPRFRIPLSRLGRSDPRCGGSGSAKEGYLTLSVRFDQNPSFHFSLLVTIVVPFAMAYSDRDTSADTPDESGRSPDLPLSDSQGEAGESDTGAEVRVRVMSFRDVCRNPAEVRAELASGRTILLTFYSDLVGAIVPVNQKALADFAAAHAQEDGSGEELE